MLRGLFICLVLVAVLPAWAGSGSRFPLLWDRNDPVLKQLESILAKLKLSRAAKRKNLAVVLVDVTDLDQPRVAAVNGDHMIYAASIPKLAILLGAFVEVGELSYIVVGLAEDRKGGDWLSRMIKPIHELMLAEHPAQVGK